MPFAKISTLPLPRCLGCKCCYDDEGELLVDVGPGGGTVDKSASIVGHYEEDVRPFQWCCGNDIDSWLCRLCEYSHLSVNIVGCSKGCRPLGAGRPPGYEKMHERDRLAFFVVLGCREWLTLICSLMSCGLESLILTICAKVSYPRFHMPLTHIK